MTLLFFLLGLSIGMALTFLYLKDLISGLNETNNRLRKELRSKPMNFTAVFGPIEEEI